MVLLLTLVVLVVLTSLLTAVTLRVRAQRARVQYQVDYAQAVYACESGVKLMLHALQTQGFEPVCVSRANEPDFSDVFFRTDEDIRALLAYYAEQVDARAQAQEHLAGRPVDERTADAGFGSEDLVPSTGSPAELIPGPYGPPWPLVAEPVQVELDEQTTVTIRVEDENAKFPIAWLLLDDPNVADALEASFETFGEWMDLSRSERSDLIEQLQALAEIKPFQTEFKPIKMPVAATDPEAPRTTARTPASRRVVRRPSTGRGSVGGRAPATRQRTVEVTVEQQQTRQDRDFAALLNSTLLDTEVLARPIYEGVDRVESPLRYIGRWGHRQVNVNTAPQHVLEAALVFGGDAVPVARRIIELRQDEPFADLEDLKKRMPRYAEHIEACEPFITTRSTHFTLRVQARSGRAVREEVLAFRVKGKTLTPVAIVSL